MFASAATVGTFTPNSLKLAITPRNGDKHNRDAEKKQQSGDSSHRQGEGHHRQNRRECRRPRSSWLETFATYMNEFADLAGDMNQPEPQKPAPTASTSTEQPQTTEPQNTNGENNNGGGNPRQAAQEIPVCPFPLEKIINAENIKCLMEIQKQLTEMIVPNLIPQASSSAISTTTATSSSTTVDGVTTATATTTVGGPQVTTSTTVTATLNSDVEMGQGDRKAPESDRDSVKSASSSSSADSKFVDPAADKADDWTMINKENGKIPFFFLLKTSTWGYLLR